MDISVIIPALNEGAVIQRAVTRAWQAGATEVIVADGGSGDDTVSRAQAANGCVVHAPTGRGPQQNAGARRARGPVLVFQHADNWLPANALDQVRQALADPAVCGGAFRQRIEAAGPAYRLVEWGNALRVRWFGLAYGDQNIFLRRELFDQLGGFPPVPLMEDVLLMRALRRHGRPVLLPGPLHVDARRWQRHGIVRQTLRNWCLLTAFHCGVSPQRLARYYTRHDQPR